MNPNYYDYFVSSDGHIFDTKTGKEIEIWVSSKLGYCNVSLNIEGKRKIRKVHRLVAFLYVHNDNPDEYNQVNHIDGDKSNNDYTNLEWCNAYLNNKHARDTGLNNISLSNRNRWEDEDFKIKAKKNMSLKAKERNMVGERNPNFKIMLKYKFEFFTIKDFSVKMNLTYSGLYQKIQKCLREGKTYFLFNEDKVNIIKG